LTGHKEIEIVSIFKGFGTTQRLSSEEIVTRMALRLYVVASLKTKAVVLIFLTHDYSTELLAKLEETQYLHGEL